MRVLLQLAHKIKSAGDQENQEVSPQRSAGFQLSTPSKKK